MKNKTKIRFVIKNTFSNKLLSRRWRDWMQPIVLFFLCAFIFQLIFLTGTIHAQEEEEEKIEIGVVLPLSGSNSVFGHIQKNSMIMAVEKINSEGGIDGTPLSLDIKNSGSRIRTARTIVKSFIENRGYPLVIGGFSSSITAAIAAYSERMGVPYLAMTGSADAITQRGYSYVFRMNPTLGMYNYGMLDFLGNVVKPEKVAIVYEENHFGLGNSRAIAGAARTFGWSVPVDYGYEGGNLKLEELIDKLDEARPDVLYLACYIGDAVRILKGLDDRQMSISLVAGSAELARSRFLSDSGAGGENAVVSVIWAPGLEYPGTAEYVQEFREKFGSEPDYHGAEAYAAVQVAADALNRAALLQPRSIAEALISTDILTVFGPVSFPSTGEFTNQNEPPTYVIQWQNARSVVVWPREFAEAEYILPTVGTEFEIQPSSSPLVGEEEERGI